MGPVFGKPLFHRWNLAILLTRPEMVNPGRWGGGPFSGDDLVLRLMFARGLRMSFRYGGTGWWFFWVDFACENACDTQDVSVGHCFMPTPL